MRTWRLRDIRNSPKVSEDESQRDETLAALNERAPRTSEIRMAGEVWSPVPLSTGFFTFKLLQSWKKAEGWEKGQTILTIPGVTEGQEPGPKGGMCTWHHDTGTRMGGGGMSTSCQLTDT